jgi:hypothetical protein
MSKATVTTNHDEIRRWAEARDGQPASVKGTGRKGEPGVLRIHFHDDGEIEESFRKVSWEDFFEKFDEEGLGFLYQDVTADGKPSRFHKFVNRDAEAATQ